MVSSRDDFVIAVRSAFLKKGNQQKFSLLSLILFSIVFLILGNFNFKIINFNKIVIKEIIYFSSFVVNIPENIIIKSFTKVSDHIDHYEDYLIIKNEFQTLRNKDLEKKIIIFENVELKKLIDDYFIEDEQVYAKVLIDKESPFLRSIIINKGSRNGVKAGMTVYDDIYLVGKIVEVNFLTSRVLLISDINSKVPITIQALNIQGIMSGLEKTSGRLQYINQEELISDKNQEELISDKNQEMIVVTSGVGGVFKSGIPIGKINLADASINEKLIVNFYRDFSQLKYVKISSHVKENINIDQSNKKIFEANNSQITKLNNQAEDIKVLKQQKIINNEIQLKLQSENIKLKKDLITVNKELRESNKEITKNNDKNKNLEFLELNLLYGHKCKKSLFKSHLFKIGTDEYRVCVLSKGAIVNADD
jgi:rod shape-determining protein MreC